MRLTSYNHITQPNNSGGYGWTKLRIWNGIRLLRATAGWKRMEFNTCRFDDKTFNRVGMKWVIAIKSNLDELMEAIKVKRSLI